MNRYFEEEEHAEIYQQFRPKIPPGVVVNILKYLEEKCPAPHPLAVDVGCGSGQTTLRLAPYFSRVIGTDISAAQIAQAQRVADLPGNINYIVSPAESLPLEPESVDVLMGTMCFHWFDLPVFYKEVKRVLQPNGVVCAVGNSPAAIIVPDKPEVTEGLHAITIEQGFKLLGPYFQPEIYTVLKRYADLDFPFAECVRESAFICDTQMTVSHYVNIVKSFSPYRAFLKDKPEEAKAMICDYEKRIMDLLGAKNKAEDEIVTVRNEFFYVMGRKQA